MVVQLRVVHGTCKLISWEVGFLPGHCNLTPTFRRSCFIRICVHHTHTPHTHTHPRTGAFIIPYLVMLFLLGIPLFYLELLLGQSLRKGPVLLWHKLLPNFTGVGIASAVVTVYICLYYNVIIAWVIFYFFNSFQYPLPWAKCFGHNVLRSNFSDVAVNFSGSLLGLERCFNESTE